MPQVPGAGEDVRLAPGQPAQAQERPAHSVCSLWKRPPPLPQDAASVPLRAVLVITLRAGEPCSAPRVTTPTTAKAPRTAEAHSSWMDDRSARLSEMVPASRTGSVCPTTCLHPAPVWAARPPRTPPAAAQPAAHREVTVEPLQPTKVQSQGPALEFQPCKLP